MSGPRELLDDRTNYDKPVEGIMIGKRGILTVNSEDECFGNTHFFGEAMHRMEMDKDMRERMLENITSYMDGYNNDLITRQWREVIEDCRNTEDKRDFIVEDTMIDMASSIIIYGAG